MDKVTGQLVDGGVALETQAALANLRAILEASGSGIERVVKTTIFVQNLEEFGTVNDEYKKGGAKVTSRLTANIKQSIDFRSFRQCSPTISRPDRPYRWPSCR